MAELYLNGASLGELAEAYGTNKCQVRRALLRHAVPLRTSWESHRLRGTTNRTVH